MQSFKRCQALLTSHFDRKRFLDGTESGVASEAVQSEATSPRIRVAKRLIELLKPFRGSRRRAHPEVRVEDAQNFATSNHIAVREQNDLRKGNPHISDTATSSPSAPSDLSNISQAVELNDKLYWVPIPSINEGLVCALVMRLVGSTTDDACWVLDMKQGAHNHVFIVKFSNETKLCMKIPATGWSKRWTTEDAAALRLEALTMRYMRTVLCDTFPSPDLLAYDTTFENEIEAPFILVTCLPGKSGLLTWYDSAVDSSDEGIRSDRREKMLESLAHSYGKAACHIISCDRHSRLRRRQLQKSTRCT
jgi:hypothetical protein